MHVRLTVINQFSGSQCMLEEVYLSKVLKSIWYESKSVTYCNVITITIWYFVKSCYCSMMLLQSFRVSTMMLLH